MTSNCRFVFATNRKVEEMINEGKFRKDLYYRINVFNIHIPPLRERKEDIPVLLDYFVKQYSSEFGLPGNLEVEKKAMNKIINYSWPGNIREMENFVIRALALLSDSENDKNVLKLNHFPSSIEAVFQNDEIKKEVKAAGEDQEVIINGNYDELVNQYSKFLIQQALKRSFGNIRIAAEILGVKRTTLNDKIKILNIK